MADSRMAVGMNAEADYDYARFERREPEAREREMEIVRTPEAPEIVAGIRRTFAARLLVTILTVLVLAVPLVYNKARIYEVTQQISDVNTELQKAQTENVRLSMELEGQLSTGNIEANADALGMAKIQRYQVTCVSLDGEDVVTVYNARESFGDRIRNLLDQLF